MVGLCWGYPKTTDLDGFIAPFNKEVFANTSNISTFPTKSVRRGQIIIIVTHFMI